MKIALTGASGFVGGAVRAALEERRAVVAPLASPRLSAHADSVAEVLAAAERHDLTPLVEGLRGCDVLVHAAGDPDASSLDLDGLVGANAVLPAAWTLAAHRAGLARVVHVSSAVVQNDVAVLDESEQMSPFSSYSLSKVLGEQAVRSIAEDTGLEVVRYRPPSVHAPGRGVTRKVARIAGSPAASVARPGDQNTPQALLANVAAAIAHLALCEVTPPPVVMHPSEGVSVTSLMRDLSGGRRPMRIPRSLARSVVAAAKVLGRRHPPTAANARRVELLWLGQGQAESWLDTTGWRPPVGPEGWAALGRDSGGGRESRGAGRQER